LNISIIQAERSSLFKNNFLNLIAIIPFLVSASPGCSPEQPSVTGQVTYRQRIALPPDAVIKIQIQDVSLADAPAEVVGEQVIQPSGKQVPIPYEVKYNPDVIQENHSYSMSVRIEGQDGKLLFISDTHTPVITRGNPTKNVEVVLVPVG
jgi:putative lipoprotein